MKQYINKDKCQTYRNKTKKVQDLINQTLHILDCFGVPMEGTPRRLERMAMAFLACGDIKKVDDFTNTKDSSSNYSLKTRAIIEFVNSNFGEKISSGSYDDIRRKDLKLLTVGDIVLQSSPNSATNDSTRGYVISPSYAKLMRDYGKSNWEKQVEKSLKGIETIGEKLKRERDINKIPVSLPSGKNLIFL